MGGCCCCSSRRADPTSASTYYYYPRASEEREPLSTHPDPASGLSTGLLVHTDLETSLIADTYRPPPPPAPFDICSRHDTQSSEATITDTHREKPDSSIQLADADDSSGKTNHDNSPPGRLEKDLNEAAEGGKISDDLELSSSLDLESEEDLKKPGETIVLVIEECPICLEDYDEDNPQLLTKCGHHFHLACILEWMERSETCPVCDQEMDIDEAISGC